MTAGLKYEIQEIRKAQDRQSAILQKLADMKDNQNVSVESCEVDFECELPIKTMDEVGMWEERLETRSIMNSMVSKITDRN